MERGYSTVQMPCTNKSFTMWTIIERLNNKAMDMLMESGWVIISSWIDNPIPIRMQVGTVCVMGISFRMARTGQRMIVTADIMVDLPTETVHNLEADHPGMTGGVAPPLSSEIWLVRFASISGYGPASNGRPGLGNPNNSVDFSVVGLDIEVSTDPRDGNMPLPHDPFISICISNGAWFDGVGEDVCHCIYTFGHHDDVTTEEGRTPIFLKAGTTEKAIEATYNILNLLSPDFVCIHNGFGFDLDRIATWSHSIPLIQYTFEDRKLGNSGTTTYWRLPNGVNFIDSMYDIDKYLRRDWNTMSLAGVAEALGLPPKLDVDNMQVQHDESYNVTKMLTYNLRDSDLHALVVKEMRTCERYFALAGVSRSSIWDPIAGNTGTMMFCCESSFALSTGMNLDLGTTSGADELEFEGGFVLEPVAGCYKGVIVIDGNSLYGSIISKLGIFIDRCASGVSLEDLSTKVGSDLTKYKGVVLVDDVLDVHGYIIMRNKDVYMCIKKGGPTALTVIIDTLIKLRKDAKSSGDGDRAFCFKTMLTSIFGMLGSRHAIISSKLCAAIITYLARYYLRMMMRASNECGYPTIYGDTDSIFVETKKDSEVACNTAGMEVKKKIYEMTRNTPFASVGADIKGNYRSIVISAKKKYEAVSWEGELETKGLAMIKKDSLRIVKYTLSKVMNVLNSDYETLIKTEKLMIIVSSVMKAIQFDKLPMSSQTAEVKVNGQPHLMYVDNNMKQRKILIGIGVVPTDVNKKWVAKRVASAVNSVLIPIGMNNVSELMFVYESRRRMQHSRSAAQRTNSTKPASRS